MTCDERQIAMDQAARGLLSPEERAVLAAHAAGCVECGSFATSISSIAQSLERHARAEAAAIDSSAVRQKLEAALRGRVRRMVFATVLQAVALGCFAWWIMAVTASGPREFLTAVIVLVVVAILTWSASAAGARDIEAVLARQGDVLAGWRTRLDAAIARHRLVAWLMPSIGLAVSGVLWLLRAPGTERAYWAGASACLLVTFGVGIRAARSLAELRRERAGLD